MTNNVVLNITVKAVVKALTERYDSEEQAIEEVQEIIDCFSEEIEDNNIFNAIVELDDLL